MDIKYDNKEIESLVNHKYEGRYKKLKSNGNLISKLDYVVDTLKAAQHINDIKQVRSLNYERLRNSDRSSVRVGFKTKYRLEFYEKEDEITLILIEVSEHYGEH